MTSLGNLRTYFIVKVVTANDPIKILFWFIVLFQHEHENCDSQLAICEKIAILHLRFIQYAVLVRGRGKSKKGYQSNPIIGAIARRIFGLHDR